MGEIREEVESFYMRDYVEEKVTIMVITRMSSVTLMLNCRWRRDSLSNSASPTWYKNFSTLFVHLEQKHIKHKDKVQHNADGNNVDDSISICAQILRFKGFLPQQEGEGCQMAPKAWPCGEFIKSIFAFFAIVIIISVLGRYGLHGQFELRPVHRPSLPGD